MIGDNENKNKTLLHFQFISSYSINLMINCNYLLYASIRSLRLYYAFIIHPNIHYNIQI